MMSAYAGFIVSVTNKSFYYHESINYTSYLGRVLDPQDLDDITDGSGEGKRCEDRGSPGRE